MLRLIRQQLRWWGVIDRPKLMQLPPPRGIVDTDSRSAPLSPNDCVLAWDSPIRKQLMGRVAELRGQVELGRVFPSWDAWRDAKRPNY